MRKGSVTIYFSIILIAVIALLGVLVEEVRFQGMKADAYNGLYLAADSAFAGYGRQLYEQYGIFGLWEAREAAAGDIVSALFDNINPGEGLSTAILDMHHMTIEHIDMKVTTLMDGGGYYFAKQAAEAMKINTGKSALNFLLNQSGMMEEAKLVSDFFKKVDAYQSRLEEVSNDLARVQERIQQASENLKNPEKSIAQLINDLKKALSQEAEKTEEEQKEEQIEFVRLIDEVFKEEEGIREEWSEIEENLSLYMQSSNELGKLFEEEKESILQEHSQNQSSFLDEEVERIKSALGTGTDDVYGFQEAQTITAQALVLLDDSKAELMKLLNADKYDGNAVMEQLQNNKAALELLQNLDIDYIKQTDCEESLSNGILERIKEVFHGGILALVADDVALPNSAITGDSLPSQINASEWKNTEESDEWEDKAWLTYYALQYFGSYEKQNANAAISCELEYLLGGKQKEQENLELVVNELFGVRESSNLLYLLSDSEKRNAAYEMAVMIPGVAAQPILTVAVQGMILAVWAAGEAILDIRTLLQGNKVPLFKNSGNWQLSLQQLQNLSENLEGNRGTGDGLTYRQYLAMILMMQTRECLCMRMLDLIQCNLQKNVNASFLVKDCICKADISVTLTGQMLFPEIANEFDNGYNIQASVCYQY